MFYISRKENSLKEERAEEGDFQGGLCKCYIHSPILIVLLLRARHNFKVTEYISELDRQGLCPHRVLYTTGKRQATEKHTR